MALLIVLSLGLSAVILRLTQVQAVSASQYEKLGVDQRIRTIKLAAERGGDLRPHTASTWRCRSTSRRCGPTPRSSPTRPATPPSWRPSCGIDAKTLTERLSDKAHAFVYLARKVDDATADAVKKLNLNGVAFVPESKRFYPSGTLAAPLLGNVGIDNDGLAGLEVQYDKMLAGKPGRADRRAGPGGAHHPPGRQPSRTGRSGAPTSS